MLVILDDKRKVEFSNRFLKKVCISTFYFGVLLNGGFYEFRRQLEYKAEWYGAKVTVANRFYPSSKMCSGCGNIKEKLSLSERIYKCEVCRLEIDRDMNAAINLEKYNENSSVSYAGSLEKETKACGVSSKRRVQNSKDTMNQEANRELIL